MGKNIMKQMKGAVKSKISDPIEHVAVHQIAQPIQHIAVDKIAQPIEHIAVEALQAAQPIQQTFTQDIPAFVKQDITDPVQQTFTKDIPNFVKQDITEPVQSFEKQTVKDAKQFTSQTFALAADTVGRLGDQVTDPLNKFSKHIIPNVSNSLNKLAHSKTVKAIGHMGETLENAAEMAPYYIAGGLLVVTLLFMM
jgi:hypothetical protein